MKIIHLLTDGLFNASTLEELKDEITEMYSSNGIKPKVTIEQNMVIVETDDEKIIRYNTEFEKAASLCSQGKIAEGREILNRIIRECPSFSDAYRLLAQLKMNEGLIDEAIDINIEALRYHPRNIWALILMGNLYAKNKDDINTGMKYYEKVLEYSPDNAIALCNIGGVLIEKGKELESLDYFDKSLENNSTYSNAYYGKALALKRLGFVRQAFEIALEGALKAKSQVENPGVREEILKIMLVIAQDVVAEENYKKTWMRFVSQLEKEGGRKIVIQEDRTLEVYAKLEYGPVYRRNYHVVKYNPEKEFVNHLVMHELMHLKMNIDNSNAGLGRFVVTTKEQKKMFVQRFGKLFGKLHPELDPDSSREILNKLLNGLNLQIVNCPMDLFVEDMIYEKYPDMRPLQLLSLFRQEQDNIDSATKAGISKMFPTEIITANRVMNIVTSLHFKKLFGMDFIHKYNPKKLEYDQAKDMYDEYEAYVDTFNTSDEYELMMYFAESLKMDDFITIETESQVSGESELEELIEKTMEDIETNQDLPNTEEINEINKDFAERHKDGEDEAQTMMMTMYILSALQDFAKRPNDEVRRIAMEMAMISTKGIHPEGKYSVSTYQGKEFGGWMFLAYYYAACAQEMPELLDKLGLPFSTAYDRAKSLFNDGKNK